MNTDPVEMELSHQRDCALWDRDDYVVLPRFYLNILNYELHSPSGLVQFCCIWKIYTYLMRPNCSLRASYDHMASFVSRADDRNITLPLSSLGFLGSQSLEWKESGSLHFYF